MSYSIGIPYAKSPLVDVESTNDVIWQPNEKTSLKTLRQYAAKLRIAYASQNDLMRSNAISEHFKKHSLNAPIRQSTIIDERAEKIVLEGLISAVEKYGIQFDSNTIITSNANNQSGGSSFPVSLYGKVGRKKGVPDNYGTLGYGSRLITINKAMVHLSRPKSGMPMSVDDTIKILDNLSGVVAMPLSEKRNPIETIVLHEFGHSLQTPKRIDKAIKLYNEFQTGKRNTSTSSYSKMSPMELIAETYVIHQLHHVDKIKFPKDTIKLMESIWGTKHVTGLSAKERQSIYEQSLDDDEVYKEIVNIRRKK